MLVRDEVIGVAVAVRQRTKIGDSEPAIATEREVRTEMPRSQEAREQFKVRGAVPSRTGMRFDPRLPFLEWHRLGKQLSMHANASVWWLGDWLAFGQAKYGRRYKQAIAITGLDYQTLRNYAVVARRFEMSRRRDKLSFQHHAEVCPLLDDEQDEWLARAEAQGWTRNELRRQLRAAHSQISVETREAELLRLLVEPIRKRRWCEAAARSSCELEVWIVHALDDQANAVLAGGQRLQVPAA
jgi:hypothetical protein